MVRMRYPNGFLDDIRARLPVSQVVSRRVALKRQGREYVGLSPFKSEKSPSFTVNDSKGFYHCFSSGEHGDIFNFVMATEGLQFPEAVERLAGEAGVQMPKSTPEAERQHDERQHLIKLTEASALFYEKQLAGAAGRDARAYLERRGVLLAMQRQFRMGFAPDSRGALKAHLAANGFAETDMVSSGMLIGGAEIAVPYDRFRGRLMIPIEDAKGRVIAFGGRALSPDAKPKYLNSPETPLFHKGSVLFNTHRARAAAHTAKAVIVVEGYMDVIALAGGGIAHAVAPLGTALTENQLALLWRMTPEPTLCFDGDDAGRKAAFRAIDVALPQLAPEASLKIAFLPKGLDPDDLMRTQGPAAVNAVLATAKPLGDVLWERERLSGTWDTPERRAQLEKRLRALIDGIRDPGVRSHYQMAMRERLTALWQPARFAGQKSAATAHRSINAPRRFMPNGHNSHARGGAGGRSGFQPPPAASDSLVLSVAQSPLGREALLLRTLLNHPWLIDEVAEDVARLSLKSDVHRRLRDGVLAAHANASALDSAALTDHLLRSGLVDALDSLERSLTHRADRFAEPNADHQDVLAGWHHTVVLHRQEIDLGDELKAAEAAYLRDPNDANWQAILEIKQRGDGGQPSSRSAA